MANNFNSFCFILWFVAPLFTSFYLFLGHFALLQIQTQSIWISHKLNPQKHYSLKLTLHPLSHLHWPDKPNSKFSNFICQLYVKQSNSYWILALMQLRFFSIPQLCITTVLIFFSLWIFGTGFFRAKSKN